MKKKAAVFFILISLISFLQSCGEKKDNAKPTISEMKFNVDSTKLGTNLFDSTLSLNFSPPIGWNEVSKNEIDAAGKAIDNLLKSNARVRVKPFYIFVKDTNHSILNVAEIKLDSVKKDFNSQIVEYEKILLQDQDSSKVKKALYMKDGIKIEQYLIQKNGFVNFRLLFDNGKGDLVQFDYLSKLEDYSNEVKAIESSIGSIKLN